MNLRLLCAVAQLHLLHSLVVVRYSERSWVIEAGTRRSPRTSSALSCTSRMHGEDDSAERQDSADDLCLISPRRRSILRWPVISSLFPVSLPVGTWAKAEPDAGTCNLDCLSDLPPLDAYHARIFLCRHGQTENNRLRRIQGARVDPSLNDTGERQSKLLGQALVRASPRPMAILHSPLERAKETAQLAASAFHATERRPPSLQVVQTLTEIDFGSTAEGQPEQLLRAEITAAYARWSIGEVDARMVGDGESSREVRYSQKYSLQCTVEEDIIHSSVLTTLLPDL